MDQAIENLRELARRLETGEHPGELGPWAADAINRWLSDAGRGCSLEQAFGLQSEGRGRPGWWLEERDRALRELAETHFGELDLRGQADRIASEAARYTAGRWRLDCQRPALPPEAAGSRRSLLWRALKAGAGRIPTSRRQLERVLDSGRKGS